MRFSNPILLSGIIGAMGLGTLQVNADSINPDMAVAAAGLSDDECEVDVYFTATTASSAPSESASSNEMEKFSKKFIKNANWTSTVTADRSKQEGDNIHFFGANQIGSYILVVTSGNGCGGNVNEISSMRTIDFGKVTGNSSRDYYLFAVVSAFNQYNVQVVLSQPYVFKLGSSFNDDF